jgi:hypothetical protein
MQYLWNVGKFLRYYKAQHPRRLSSTCSPPWEPYISSSYSKPWEPETSPSNNGLWQRDSTAPSILISALNCRKWSGSFSGRFSGGTHWLGG